MSIFANTGVNNNGGALSMQSGLLINLPAFGVRGRYFTAIDTSEMFFDTGASWINLTNNGGGGAFLPLTGGTLTGALNGTTANFSSTITGGSIVRAGGTSAQFLKADGSVDNTSYASTTALSGYLPLTGGTLTGALYGTSASFSGTISSALGIIDNGTGGGRITIEPGNARNTLFSTTTLFGTYNELRLQAGNWSFNNATGDVVTISNTGNAIFSGSVTAANFVGAGAGITALNGSNIASGTVAPARLGSGTPTSATALFGDGTWKNTQISLSGSNNTNAPSSDTPAVLTTSNGFETWQRVGNIIFVSGSFTVVRVGNGVSTLTFSPPVPVVNLVTELQGSFLWNDLFATHLKSSDIGIDGTNVFCNMEITGTFSATAVNYFYSYNI